jgi:hypothetical protein
MDTMRATSRGAGMAAVPPPKLADRSFLHRTLRLCVRTILLSFVAMESEHHVGLGQSELLVAQFVGVVELAGRE